MFNETRVNTSRKEKAMEEIKNPHTIGRRGAANTTEELKKQNPNDIVTRTQIYVASHTKKDGTCPFPIMSKQIDEVRRIILNDPFLGEGDLDNDPIAKIN